MMVKAGDRTRQARAACLCLSLYSLVLWHPHPPPQRPGHGWGPGAPCRLSTQRLVEGPEVLYLLARWPNWEVSLTIAQEGKKGSFTSVFPFVVEKCDSCCHA